MTLDGIGPGPLVLGVFGLVFFLVCLRRAVYMFSDTHFGPPLVIQECRVYKEAKRGVYVTLRGRPEGILSLLASLLGLGTEVRFEVSAHSISKNAASLTRRLSQDIPCQNVASTEYGFSRNFLLLLLVALFLLVGIATLVLPLGGAGLGWGAGAGGGPRDGGGAGTGKGLGDPGAVPGAAGQKVNQIDAAPKRVDWYSIVSVAGFVAALVFLLAYFLSKRLKLEIESSGGRRVGIKFKPSLIEGVPIDIDMAQEIVATINRLAGKTTTA